MGRRVNPISVRLQLNRSSDSSRFSDYDCNHGEPVYRDVNLIVYFGSIRLPTRRGKTFGFRLGRCILHHSPKRTFIHLFLPRRGKKRRRRRRGRSRPRKQRWWAMGKGWSIGRLDRKDSTRSAFRSRAPTNYIHPPTHPYNSPPPGYRLGWAPLFYGGGEQTRVRVLSTARERETLGRVTAEYPPLSRVGGWIGALKAAPTPEAVESPPLSTLSIVGGWIGAPLLWIGRERGINALKALTGLDDRSEVIWRRRSPSSQYFFGGSHKCYLRVSGWLAHKPMSVSSRPLDSRANAHRILRPSAFRRVGRPTIYRAAAKCFNFLLPRIHSHSRRHSGHALVNSGATSRRRLLQTIPAVRPSSNYLVMQYSFHMENRIWIWGINHFVAPDSSLELYKKGGRPHLNSPYIIKADESKRIRFFVESLTAKTRSAAEPYPARSGHYLDFLRSLLFPLLGATLFFLMENEMRGGPKGKRKKKRFKRRRRNARRKQLLGQLGRVLRNRLGSTRLVEQFTDLGGLVRRRIGMMIRIIPKNRRIPYGYNYYLNEVRKMRSLLSGGTNANTFIGSVKIKSVYQSASPIAQDISFQPRDGTRSFRSILWKIVRGLINSRALVMPKLRKGVGGIRICRPGRLKGAEIARTECREYGKTSCNTFRHQIDYAYAKVSTRYGILGVKVWIPFPRG